MTFQNVDDILVFLEQLCADTQRECETDLLTRDHTDLVDDIADVIDDARERYDEEMVAWRMETRRRLAALPFRFPLTIDYVDARARPRDEIKQLLRADRTTH